MTTDIVLGFHIGLVIYTALATIFCVGVAMYYTARLIVWLLRK